MARHMPALSQSARTPLRDQARILKDPLLLAHIGLSVAVFTAMFTTYTYLADILERLAGVAPAQVGWWLMGFGAVGLIGNALGGKAVDRHPLRATLAFTLLLGLGTLASMPLAASLGGLLPALAAWSIANTALYPICQVRVMQAAPRRPRRWPARSTCPLRTPASRWARRWAGWRFRAGAWTAWATRRRPWHCWRR